MIKIDSVNLPAIVFTMRRLIILFMLCLLPVQISWAAVADYCTHEPSGGEQHFAHHDDEHAPHHTAPAEDPSDTGDEPSQYSIGYDHCHLSGFIGLLGESTLAAAIVPVHPVMQTENHPFSSQILDRPERPKWHPLA